jgi:hypothetical protein
LFFHGAVERKRSAMMAEREALEKVVHRAGVRKTGSGGLFLERIERDPAGRPGAGV